ncbi:hypothetical protein BJV82DRAFT_675508 [Fennellomyces sp. T-0311]|nr:hypothetical protein BJV82DRAFT_675508 [Fennellomyces sp. T-0311]
MTRNKNTPPPRRVTTRSQSQSKHKKKSREAKVRVPNKATPFLFDIVRTVSNVPPIVNAGQARTSVAGQSFPLITPSPISGTSQGHLASPMQSRDQTPFMLQASRFASVSTPEQGVHVLPQSLAPQPVHSPQQQQYIPESSIAGVSGMLPAYPQYQYAGHVQRSPATPTQQQPLEQQQFIEQPSSQQQSIQQQPLRPIQEDPLQQQNQETAFESLVSEQAPQLQGLQQPSHEQLDQPRALVQPLPLEFRRTHPYLVPEKLLTLAGLENGDERFWRAVRKEVFLHDALPEFRAQVAAVKILKEMHNVNDPYNEHFRYTATEDVVRKLTTIASSERTKCQTAASSWLTGYYFHFGQYIPPIDDSIDPRVHMYEQLMEKSRFARQGYRLDGPLLQNKCIADCMYTIFCHPNSSRPRLNSIPRPIPRSLIAYTYSLIYYRLGLGCKHEKTKKPKGKSFSKDSNWAKAYQHILDPESVFGKAIDWESVQQFLAETLPDGDGHSDTDGFDPHEYF